MLISPLCAVAAALCRRLYNRPGMGVGHLEGAFGSRARRGVCPEKHAKAAGKLDLDMGTLQRNSRSLRKFLTLVEKKCYINNCIIP